jgi:hypothetical protein
MNSRVALITFLDGQSGNVPDNTLPSAPVYPSHGLPGFGGAVDPGFGVRPPVDPGYGRPGFGGGHPSTGFPPNYPSTGPVFPPVGPDNTLPDSPSTPPPQISLPIYLPSGGTKPVEPEAKFELKYSFRFGWVLVPVGEDVAQPK